MISTDLSINSGSWVARRVAQRLLFDVCDPRRVNSLRLGRSALARLAQTRQLTGVRGDACEGETMSA